MTGMLRPAIALLLLLTFVTGVVYPLAVTGVAQVFFHHAANGSVIERGDEKLGSELIGQPFDDPRYFRSRPSATPGFAYNSAASAGSNLGPTNPALAAVISARVAALREADLQNRELIPVDLVTASASGLDPDLSPAAAQFQLSRVARVRGMPIDAVAELVAQATQARQFGVFGEPRVNVLRLNLSLDALLTDREHHPGAVR